jgi:cell division protein FtsB
MLMIRSVLFSAVLPAAMLVGGAYQALMAVNGPDGLKQAEHLAAVKEERAAALDELKREREKLERRADRLVLVSLDEDLLEETARANLGLMKPGEYRIPLDDLDRVAAAEASSGAELTNLIAVALLDETGV